MSTEDKSAPYAFGIFGFLAAAGGAAMIVVQLVMGDWIDPNESDAPFGGLEFAFLFLAFGLLFFFVGLHMGAKSLKTRVLAKNLAAGSGVGVALGFVVVPFSGFKWMPSLFPVEMVVLIVAMIVFARRALRDHETTHADELKSIANERLKPTAPASQRPPLPPPGSFRSSRPSPLKWLPFIVGAVFAVIPAVFFTVNMKKDGFDLFPKSQIALFIALSSALSGGFGFVVTWLGVRRRARFEAEVDTFAEHVGGTVTTRKLMLLPIFKVVEFTHEGERACLDTEYRGSGDSSYPYTFLRFWLPDDGPLSDICPCMVSGSAKKNGKISLGYDLFDDLFEVEPKRKDDHTETAVRSCFPRPVQESLLRLRAWAEEEMGGRHVELRVRRDEGHLTLTLYVSGTLDDAETMLRFYELCSDIQGSLPEGVTKVGQPLLRVTADTVARKQESFASRMLRIAIHAVFAAPILFFIVWSWWASFVSNDSAPGEMTVTVLDTQGNPVEGAQVYVGGYPSPLLSDEVDVTDSNGSALVMVGSFETNYDEPVAWVRKAGFAPVARPLDRAEKKSERATVVVDTGCTVRGRMLFEGQPLTEANVKASAGKSETRWGKDLEDFLGGSIKASVDGMGQFHLKGIPWRSIKLICNGNTEMGSREKHVDIEAKPGSETQIDISFEMVGTGSIEGQVIASENCPMVKYPLIVQPRDGAHEGEMAKSKPGSDGSYRIDGLPAGEYTISTLRFCLERDQRRIGAHRNKIAVLLHENATIERDIDLSGTCAIQCVLGEDAKRWGFYAVSVLQGEVSIGDAWPPVLRVDGKAPTSIDVVNTMAGGGPDSSLRFDGFLPGTYTVVVHKLGKRATRVTEPVLVRLDEPGAVVRVELPLVE